eukprot:gnl/Ergobibamus_cyprinoides/766.p1 GENE.gnl/Ergobibamus_cyprinoides/766~~gnl/Ergobibamus_cyprinoides/766.p1  ORF type:complete len:457 (+),score=204.19 gnl/Ergobibamus_cyprinoides/766:124-1371(+)
MIPPGDQLSRSVKMLQDEFGTASNIKSRVTRLSVLGAITSVQQRLKLYSKVPPNGLVVYCGTVIDEEGKERKFTMDLEPFKPINTSLYRCDSRFLTEPLRELLVSDEKFGFIVMDGHGTLFGTICGSSREVIQKITVDLPKKHGRGGQSSVRFARLREEKRHNYLRKVAELSTQHFIGSDHKVNVRGLILAGSADFKSNLATSELFDPRLAAAVLKTVDVSYGGENGFNQAIELSQECMSNVKFVQEKRVISAFFDEISQDTGKYVYGVKDTLHMLDTGAVEKIIMWEDHPIERFEVRNTVTEQTAVLHLTPEQAKDSSHFRAEDGAELEVVEQMLLSEWFVLNYVRFGVELEFVSNKSQEGSQFVKGFGGVGGFLRWKVDMLEMGALIDGHLADDTGVAADDLADFDDDLADFL